MPSGYSDARQSAGLDHNSTYSSDHGRVSSGTRTAPAAQPMSKAGNATVVDKAIETAYQNAPAEGIDSDRDYWNAIGNFGKRYADYKDYGNSTLDNIGNLVAGMFGVGEMDPTKQALGAAINKPTASWGFDPLSLALGVGGQMTGLPLSLVYKGLKMATGYPGPQIALDGNQYLRGGLDSSPIAQGAGIMSGAPSGAGLSPAHLGKNDGGGQSLTPLQQAVAAASQGSSAPISAATNPSSSTSDTDAAHSLTYNPYGGNYLTYGQNDVEHPFFMKEGGPVRSGPGGAAAAAMHDARDPMQEFDWQDEAGNHYYGAERRSKMNQKQQMYQDFGHPDTRPQYRSFGGFLKKIAKTVAPALIGAGTSALTGSDILGGLAAGGSSKLFGNDWLTAGLTGLGTGVMSNLTGLDGALSSGNPYSDISVADSAGHVFGGDGGGGGIMDFIKNNPLPLAGGALTMASLIGQKKAKTQDASNAPNPANDPAYADQIRKGGLEWGRTPTDTSKVDWYQYGKFPEWDFFDNEDSFTPKAKGGPIPGKPALGGGLDTHAGGLDTHGGQANGPGGGQDDKIPVYLSAKEYVVPADVVSDLGDGNPDEGARKLNGLRDNVRKQKGRKGFPKKAKPTVAGYM